MKILSIVGSTGSIGTQTLDVVASRPDLFRVAGLAARRSWEQLAAQALEFKPEMVAVLDESVYPSLKEALASSGIRVGAGMAAVEEVAALESSHSVVSALVGMAGLRPTLAALNARKELALANKESLVVSGELMLQAAQKSGSAILPVDSEHSAIFQCLQSGSGVEISKSVERIILTASGGPFRKIPKQELSCLTAKQALQHPTWSMGAKITIDSASLMNKGFEVIEAHYLFGVDYPQIDVWVHPQSIVHSCVEFCDGSVLAQMGPPDMRTPISYALHYPERRPPSFSRLTLEHMRSLTFEEPRLDDFPNLRLAYRAGAKKGTAPAVLNAANEVAVELFLHDKINFGQLSQIVSDTLEHHLDKDWNAQPSLDDLFAVDQWARSYASQLLTSTSGRVI